MDNSVWDSLYKDVEYIYNPFTKDYKELPESMQYVEEIVLWGSREVSFTCNAKFYTVQYWYSKTYIKPEHLNRSP